MDYDFYLAGRSHWEPGGGLADLPQTTGRAVLGQVGPVLHQLSPSLSLLGGETSPLPEVVLHEESQVVPVSRGVLQLSSEQGVVGRLGQVEVVDVSAVFAHQLHALLVVGGEPGVRDQVDGGLLQVSVCVPSGVVVVAASDPPQTEVGLTYDGVRQVGASLLGHPQDLLASLARGPDEERRKGRLVLDGAGDVWDLVKLPRHQGGQRVDWQEGGGGETVYDWIELEAGPVARVGLQTGRVVRDLGQVRLDVPALQALQSTEVQLGRTVQCQGCVDSWGQCGLLLSEGEEEDGAALGDGSTEQAGVVGREDLGLDTHGSSALSKYRDPGGVSSHRPDVVPHPPEKWRYIQSSLSLVELLHYCALIGRELHSNATPAL